jgi:dextranase
MKSIFYNLCFGAWKNATNDGVKTEWALLKNNAGNYEQDYHGLPDSWASNIYLQVPSNQGWLQYMVERNEEVYDNFGFDGFQIDQLGYRGTVYDANRHEVDLPSSYESFIQAMKQAHPDKALVMNAVSGYGAEQIVRNDIDFCYNEVWGNGNGYGGASEDQFANLFGIIQTNDKYSDHQHPTVFAAFS